MKPGGLPTSVDERIRRFLDGAQPDSIILMRLMHGRDESIRAVTSIARQLKYKTRSIFSR